MGTMRVNWTFPVRGDEIIKRAKAREAELVSFIEEQLDAEQIYERDLAEYREKFRIAGIQGWETAMPPKPTSYYNDPGSRAKERYNKAAKTLQEYKNYRMALEFDLVREPDRLYKLTYDDLNFFGFSIKLDE